MSPVSRQRKQPKTKSGQPQGQSAPPTTPGYSTVERRIFGPEPPAEVKLLAVLSDAWQVMAQGLPANHCIHAVTAIRSVLDAWGVDSEPVVVTASVEWPNLRVRVGSPTPAWGPKGGWSGHLGLWIPLLGRFMDPTLYQANRSLAPTLIDRGIIIPVHPRTLAGAPFGTVYGAEVAYRVIDGIDALGAIPSRGRAEVRKTTDHYRAFITGLVADDSAHMAAIRRGLTVGPLASALWRDSQTHH